MKLHLLKLTLAAMAGIMIIPAVHAGIYTAANEDMILSFRDSSSSNDLQIDLGSITQFTSAHATFSLNIGTDLSNIFGTGFYNDSNLMFSVAGTNKSTSTVNGYAKSSVFVSDPTTVPFSTFSANGLSTPKTVINDLYTTYNPTPTASATANSDIVPTSTTNAYAQAGVIGNGNYNSFSGVAETTFGLGSDPKLYLDILTPNSSVLAQDANGNNYAFSISSTGVLTYSVESVPEPSTYALILLGAAGLFGIYRRKAVSNL